MQAVVTELMKQFVVQTTCERVAAYKHYREQVSDYWIVAKLERFHWESLCARVKRNASLSHACRGRDSKVVERRLLPVRATFCKDLGLARVIPCTPIRLLGGLGAGAGARGRDTMCIVPKVLSVWETLRLTLYRESCENYQIELHD